MFIRLVDIGELTNYRFCQCFMATHELYIRYSSMGALRSL